MLQQRDQPYCCSIPKTKHYKYIYNQEEDVVRVTANVSSSEEPIEAFSIMFDGEEEDNTTMLLGWGNTVISIPVSKK